MEPIAAAESHMKVSLIRKPHLLSEAFLSFFEKLQKQHTNYSQNGFRINSTAHNRSKVMWCSILEANLKHKTVVAVSRHSK